jgi:hypothetical protein
MPDPDDVYDKQGWIDKLNSLPEEMPEDPEIAEQAIHEMFKCSCHTIARILANEMYTGTLVQGKSHHISYKNKKRKKVEGADWVRIANAHEAIIDMKTWSRTLERLNSHARVGKRSQELSPLSGKVRCAACGRPMIRNVYYNKAKAIRHYNLQCAAHKTGAMDYPVISPVSRAYNIAR